MVSVFEVPTEMEPVSERFPLSNATVAVSPMRLSLTVEPVTALVSASVPPLPMTKDETPVSDPLVPLRVIVPPVEEFCGNLEIAVLTAPV
jgi:hypothetical protein